jgi:hypothetical protein
LKSPGMVHPSHPPRARRNRTPCSRSLANRFQAEDSHRNRAENGVGAVRIAAILIPAVKAVFIAAAEALAEVVAVVALVYEVAPIAVVPLLIGIRVLIAGPPTVLAVCLSGAIALLIAIVDGLPEQIHAVLIGVIVVAAERVPIIRGRIKEQVAIGVVVTCVLETYVLPSRQVLLLKPILRHPILLL